MNGLNHTIMDYREQITLAKQVYGEKKCRYVICSAGCVIDFVGLFW